MTKGAVPKTPATADPQLQRTLEALREAVEIFRGVRGDPLDKALTLRDLVDAGLIAYKLRGRTLGGTRRAGSPITPIYPAQQTGGYAPCSDIPAAPANAAVTVGLRTVILTWDIPAGTCYGYAEIARSTSNDVNAASIIARIDGTLYVDSPAPGTYYYWIRFYSQDGSVHGAWHNANGLQATVQQDITWLLQQLAGSITSTELSASLDARISTGETANLIATAEQQLRQNIIAQDWSASASYAQGDFVVYNGQLYQANTTPTPGTWVASEWTLVNQLPSSIDQVSATAARIDSTIDQSLAPYFDSAKTYNAGDLVIYNGQLYEAAVATGPGWVPADWVLKQPAATVAVAADKTAAQASQDANSALVTATREQDLRIASIAPDWLSSQTYKPGDRVVYDDGSGPKIWRALQTVSGTAPATNSPYWQVDDLLTASIQILQNIRFRTVAPDWDPNATYKAGETVVDPATGDVYRAVIDVTSPGIALTNTSFWQPASRFYSQYTVKLDTDGKVIGFGLANDGPGNALDEFVIRADRFSVTYPVLKWTPNTAYQPPGPNRSGDLVVPSTQSTGLVYEVTAVDYNINGGRSGSVEPAWPANLADVGTTFQDGGITYTVRDQLRRVPFSVAPDPVTGDPVVWIDVAAIREGSISDAHIASLTADKIVSGKIRTAITVASVWATTNSGFGVLVGDANYAFWYGGIVADAASNPQPDPNAAVLFMDHSGTVVGKDAAGNVHMALGNNAAAYAPQSALASFYLNSAAVDALQTQNAPAEAGADNTGGKLEDLGSLLVNGNLNVADSAAKPAGLLPGDSNVVDRSAISYVTSATEKFARLYTGAGGSPRASFVFPAIPIDDRQKYNVIVRFRANGQLTGGATLQFYFEESNSVLPMGKTHIGEPTGALHPKVVNANSVDPNAVSLTTVPAVGVWDEATVSYVYTPTAGTKFASFGVFHWGNADQWPLDVDAVYVAPVAKTASDIQLSSGASVESGVPHQNNKITSSNIATFLSPYAITTSYFADLSVDTLKINYAAVNATEFIQLSQWSGTLTVSVTVNANGSRSVREQLVANGTTYHNVTKTYPNGTPTAGGSVSLTNYLLVNTQMPAPLAAADANGLVTVVESIFGECYYNTPLGVGNHLNTFVNFVLTPMHYNTTAQTELAPMSTYHAFRRQPNNSTFAFFDKETIAVTAAQILGLKLYLDIYYSYSVPLSGGGSYTYNFTMTPTIFRQLIKR